MKIQFTGFRKMAYFLSFFALIIFITSSCRKDEVEIEYKDVNVVFKVEGSNGVMINAIVTQIGTAQSTNYTVTGTSWKSNGQVVNTQQGAVHLSATATGVDDQSSLTVSILVNDKLVNTQTVNGIDLIAKTSIQFKNVIVKH